MWPKNRLIEHAVSLDAKSTPLIEEPIGTDMLASPSGIRSFPIFRWRRTIWRSFFWLFTLDFGSHTAISKLRRSLKVDCPSRM
jgi:hypothetical protein